MSTSELKFSLYRVPLSTVLEWPQANTIDPESRHWFIPYASVLEILSTLVLAARLWTRVGRTGGGLGRDDILIVLAWIFASAHLALGIYGVAAAGLDRHVWDISPEVAVRSGLVGWTASMMFLLSMSLTKISVLLFFLRLLDRRCHTMLYYTVHAGVTIIVLGFFAFFFVLIFACKPVNAAWLAMDWQWPGKYNCAARELSDLFNGVFAIGTDVYAVVLPVFIVRGLQITRTRKAMLYVVFCCGLAVIGASIARTFFGKRIYQDERSDLTWVGHDLLVWATLELQLALICASAPAIKGFLSKLGETMTSRRDTHKDASATSQHDPWSGSGRDVMSFKDALGAGKRHSFMMYFSRPNVEVESLEELHIHDQQKR